MAEGGEEYEACARGLGRLGGCLWLKVCSLGGRRGRHGQHWVRTYPWPARTTPSFCCPQGLPLVAQTGTAICWSPHLLPLGIVLLPLWPALVSALKRPTHPPTHPELSRSGTDVSCVSMGCGLQEQMHLLKRMNVTLEVFHCVEMTSQA